VNRRLAVVGTLLVDSIHRPGEEIVESLGGIAYSVAYLAAQLAETAEVTPLSEAGQVARGDPRVDIQPICRVGADLFDELKSSWEQLPGVDPSHLIPDPKATPRNTLVYGGGGVGADGVGDRSERPTGLLAPLTERDLAPIEGADLALVNCITGRDLSLSAFRRVSAVCERVYLDVHSLALGFADDGTRTYRRPPDWQSWIARADVVQCNRAEAATLAGLDAFDHSPSLVDEFLQRLLMQAAERHTARPSVVVLTEGAKGATLLWRCGGGVERAGRVERTLIPAPAVDVVDPTGAGDAFGSGYALAWLQGADPPEAATRGSRTGSAACTVSGISEPEKLREAVERGR